MKRVHREKPKLTRGSAENETALLWKKNFIVSANKADPHILSHLNTLYLLLVSWRDRAFLPPAPISEEVGALAFARQVLRADLVERPGY